MVNLKLLARGVELSGAAYVGVDDAFHFKAVRGTVTAFLRRNHDMDELAFTGSNDAIDWALNLAGAFVPVKYGEGWCHGGFAYAHKSVWGDIFPLLDMEKPLLVTGHSLGGALAEKTCDFLRRWQAPVHMVTFGKPNVHLKVATPRLWHLATQLSVVHGSDVVARLPRYFYGPDPGQDMLYLANSGQNIVNPSAALRRADWGLRDAAKDHLIARYADRVATILEWKSLALAKA